MSTQRELEALILKDHLDPSLAKSVQFYLTGAESRPGLVREALQGSIDAAVRLFETVLPGWEYRLGRNSAWQMVFVQPDWFHPVHQVRLEQELWPDAKDESMWIDVELRPPLLRGPAVAMVIAIIRATAFTRSRIRQRDAARRRLVRDRRNAKKSDELRSDR
ncbi:hypothetical protein DF3PB_10042 [uncultured Defluviicoccus sp.]|uniref:Uncharacterized protein n=1 Tax=metagenome TaxID=256318 RepID=A0A380T809_9ZZZZ|nr:hypothetical protein DF3PB_10042 [uncultured Defluviicoccus sp.]